GRVTDDKDRRTLVCLLARCYNPGTLREGYPLSHDLGGSSNGGGVSPYCVPADGDGTAASYLAAIDALPLVTPPEVFGLHANASITRANKETTELLASVLAAEGGGAGGSGSGGAEQDAAAAAAATNILARLP
ncbi:unnamed protein product, partial [Phaeothamnion confervicola]